MESLLDQAAKNGTLEQELIKFIICHSGDSVFCRYETYGIAASSAACGLSDDLYERASAETRKKALEFGEILLDEFLDSYVGTKHEIDFEVFDLLCRVFHPDLSTDLDNLLSAIKMTDKDFTYLAIWNYNTDVNVQSRLLPFLVHNQNRATELQKREIDAVWTNIWEFYPKKGIYAVQRWLAFSGMIGLNGQRIIELYPKLIKERKRYCPKCPYYYVDFEIRAKGLDMMFGLKLVSTPEEIAEMDEAIARN